LGIHNFEITGDKAMNSQSLRALAKTLGVSHSYLSQVKSGKRPASPNLVSRMVSSGLNESGLLPYNDSTWWRSSVAEQGTHKPLVTSSNLVATSFYFND
jgi:hypothetical protein